MLVGCNKMDSNGAIKKYKNLLNDNSMYVLKGIMDIVSNEELYHYNVEVDYMQGDYYKATLQNIDNKSEQIILKNENGVYVITPDLNKSFKFESEWPYNSSQSYILASILKDLENDSNVVFEESGDDYILSSTVNYPNNSSLVSQKVTFDKEMYPKSVEVYNKEGIVNITFKISELNFKPTFSEDNFEVESSASDDCCEETSKIDEVIYPLYLPVGTTFKSEETVKTDESERVILTFSGEKSFILIEEAASAPKEFEVMSTSGELVFYENILGSLNETSLTWNMNGKNYYIIGENLTNEELLKVASSTSIVASTK